MKKILFCLFCLLFVDFFVFAQDVIVKKDYTTIMCKVEEVASDNVRYRKWENLDGPVYVLERASIRSINYQNGTNDIFEEDGVTQDDVTSVSTAPIVKNTVDANVDFLKRDDLLKTARAYNIGSKVCTITGGLLTVSTVILGVAGVIDEVGVTVGVCLGVGVSIPGGLLAGKARIYKKQAYEIEMASLMENRIDDSNVYACANVSYDRFRKTSSLGLGVNIRF